MLKPDLRCSPATGGSDRPGFNTIRLLTYIHLVKRRSPGPAVLVLAIGRQEPAKAGTPNVMGHDSTGFGVPALAGSGAKMRTAAPDLIIGPREPPGDARRRSTNRRMRTPPVIKRARCSLPWEEIRAIQPIELTWTANDRPRPSLAEPQREMLRWTVPVFSVAGRLPTKTTPWFTRISSPGFNAP